MKYFLQDQEIKLSLYKIEMFVEGEYDPELAIYGKTFGIIRQRLILKAGATEKSWRKISLNLVEIYNGTANMQIEMFGSIWFWNMFLVFSRNKACTAIKKCVQNMLSPLLFFPKRRWIF